MVTLLEWVRRSLVSTMKGLLMSKRAVENLNNNRGKMVGVITPEPFSEIHPAPVLFSSD